MVVLPEELPNITSAAKKAHAWLKSGPNRETRAPRVVESRPRQAQRRLSEADELAVVAAYQSGKSVYEVGELFKIHRTTASAIMQRRGVKLRRQKKRSYRRSSPD